MASQANPFSDAKPSESKKNVRMNICMLGDARSGKVEMLKLID